jgi:hypothetical protein
MRMMKILSEGLSMKTYKIFCLIVFLLAGCEKTTQDYEKESKNGTQSIELNESKNLDKAIAACAVFGATRNMDSAKRTEILLNFGVNPNRVTGFREHLEAQMGIGSMDEKTCAKRMLEEISTKPGTVRYDFTVVK